MVTVTMLLFCCVMIITLRIILYLCYPFFRGILSERTHKTWRSDAWEVESGDDARHIERKKKKENVHYSYFHREVMGFRSGQTRSRRQISPSYL